MMNGYFEMSLKAQNFQILLEVSQLMNHVSMCCFYCNS